ncbi:right-handed parallel beta-helix repeat-containing protein [candidate division KSB1 bacterium]|nr:right-handed parallel beta-helix repeat-containing protein [candidate division KSB1 bacterium]
MKKIFFVFTVLMFVLPSAAKDKNIRDISVIGPRTKVVDLQSYQDIYHVSAQQGSDREGDGSREKPWRTLTAAMANIANAAADHAVAVLVSAGTYDSTTIVMKEWVDLFGGFCPVGWQRDIFKHRTILDGVRLRRVVVGADHARLDGFVIRRGVTTSHGAGILCVDVSPTISNNVIIDNLALEPADFDYQHIYQPGNHGGGIASFYNAVPVIRNNIIAQNRTSIGCGGGVAFYGWLRMEGITEPEMQDNFLVGGLQPVLENNVIVDNVSGLNDTRRTRSSSGGAVLCAHEARPVIRNNVIAGNRAMGRSDAGGIYIEYYSYPVIEGNWILGNVAEDDGGAIYTMRNGQPLIRANFVAGNWTTGGGVGGLRMSKEGRARVVENMIVHNQSGGGVQCIDSYMELEDNIIMHNKGGGALSYMQHFPYFSSSIVRRNIMRENERGTINIRQDYGRPLIVELNNIQGGFEGEGNYDRKPEFIDDVVKGMALSVSFDPVSCTTTAVLKKAMDKKMQLAGRVMRLGKEWSVIRSADDKKIILWGDLSDARDEGLEFEIISQYRLQ